MPKTKLAIANNDVLGAINKLAATNEKRFEEVLESVNKFANDTEQRFEKIEKDVTQIKTTMVTKDYLDIKLADLKGDLTSMLRKEDLKLATLVDVLAKKSVISKADAKQILTLQPFPQLAL